MEKLLKVTGLVHCLPSLIAQALKILQIKISLANNELEPKLYLKR